MNYYPDSDQEWNQIHPQDLWIYNKLFLSRVLGYNCGPFGTSVPKPDFYIVRPSFNLEGMGRCAKKMFIRPQIEGNFNEYDMHPSDFWCEIFEGEHLSVDFHHQKSELVVLGEREDENTFYKWKKWSKIDKKVEFPSILTNLVGEYEWINCEFIGNNLIEVHFRRNPDFRWKNSECLPVWDEEMYENMKNNCDYRFIPEKDYYRIGYFVK